MAEQYQVESTDQFQELTPGGRFQDSIRVVFVTKPHGSRGEVVFPADSFDRETVRATLEVRAAELEALFEL